MPRLPGMAQSLHQHGVGHSGHKGARYIRIRIKAGVAPCEEVTMNDKTTSGNPPPSGKLTPYDWQRAILASDLPSTTKLVLMALSTHINRSNRTKV
jgi:hypothetical protein